jgi:hypothetical protein
MTEELASRDAGWLARMIQTETSEWPERMLPKL